MREKGTNNHSEQRKNTESKMCKAGHIPRHQQNLLSADPVVGWLVIISLLPKLKLARKIRDLVRILHCANRTSSLHFRLNITITQYQRLRRFFDPNTGL